jgi:hypothetical protein
LGTVITGLFDHDKVKEILESRRSGIGESHSPGISSQGNQCSQAQGVR